MKKKWLGLVILMFLIFVSFSSYAAVPQTINYQGYITSSAGQPLNGTVSMTFKLYNVASGGSALWTETQASVNVTNGVYSVILGSVAPITLAFDAQYYLGVTVGADPEMTPRQALTVVPYAFRSVQADNVSSSANISTQNQIVSTVTTGTAPFQVASTTRVTNLNADMVDDKHAGDFVLKAGDTMTGTLNITQSAATGQAGYFRINNVSNTSPVFLATTNGSGDAVYGSTSGSGSAVSGVTSGTGMAGYFQIGNASNSSAALYVTTSGTGYVGYFQSNNASSTVPALRVEASGSYAAINGYAYGSGYSGSFGGGAGVYISGNLNVTGTKNFVQPHPKDPSKQIAYVAVEAPESAVIIRGKGKLADGRAVIETPEYFRLVAGSDEDITVQFTPRSEDSNGLAAVEVTKEKIVVKELMKGKGTYEFDYFITAKRAGFEKHAPIQPNTHFTADMSTKEEFEKKYSKTDDMAVLAIRNLLISNGILTKDGKLNMEVAAKLGWKIKEADLALINK